MARQHSPDVDGRAGQGHPRIVGIPYGENRTSPGISQTEQHQGIGLGLRRDHQACLLVIIEKSGDG